MSKEKPKAKLIGENGNIFNLMRIAVEALKANGQYEDAEKLIEDVKSSGSYDKALFVIGSYVDIE